MRVPDPPRIPVSARSRPSCATTRPFLPATSRTRSTTTRAGTRSSTTWWCSSPTARASSSGADRRTARSGPADPTRDSATSGPRSLGTWIGTSNDCVEPLQDKELRYGRVEIVESTPARVHVRWSYQSCDLDYKVGGNFAVEDYYFYPDGFGTRVLTLTANPGCTRRDQRVHHLHAAVGLPVRLRAGQPGRHAVAGGKGRIPVPVSLGTSNRRHGPSSRRSARTSRCCIASGSANTTRWPRSATAPGAARTTCRASRRSPTAGDRHADVLGLPLALEPRVSDRLGDQRPHPRDAGTQLVPCMPARPSRCGPGPARCATPGDAEDDAAGHLGLADRHDRRRRRRPAAMGEELCAATAGRWS